MDPIILAKTYTTKFILPLLVKDNITYDKLFENNFVNAHISHSDFLPEHENSIIVAFSNIDFIGKQQLLFNDEELDYMLNDETEEWLLIYKLKEEYSEDYINFISGNYSLLSNNAKNKIISFWNATENSLLYSILHKDATNIKELIKSKNNPNNPWKRNYSGLLDKVKRNEELYKPPTLSSEIDYYYINKGDT